MHTLRIAMLTVALTACQDQPARTTGPVPPPPQSGGVSASVTVDNLSARVGQTVRVRVEVQVGTGSTFKVGSFTGRLRFDPARLAFRTENAISDGLRVANAAGAPQGEIRFAGASPSGFNTLVLYDGTFEVKTANYAQNLRLQMEELSAALSLTNLSTQLRVNNQVYLSRVANR